MSFRKVLVPMTLLLPLLAGCGNSDVKEMSKKPWVAQTAHWPELDALHNGPSGNLQRAMRMAGAVQMPVPVWFNEPQFTEALQKFETTPIPSEYDNEERQKLKTELIALIKKLQGAKGSPSKEVAKDVRELKYVYDRITFVPNQTPPTGADAAKYSAVIPPVEPVKPEEPGAKKI